MKEIWKNIPNYKDYQASNLGRIKSLKFNREKILKQSIASGYYQVFLYKPIKVHKVIGMTFLGYTLNGNTVVLDHIDGNKLNNHLDNLQLISHRDNTAKAFRGKKTSSKYTGVCWYKPTKKWKAAIGVNGKHKNIGYFNTELEASDAYQKELTKIRR